MVGYLTLLLFAILAPSLSDARSRRSVGSITLRATPRLAVQGVTEQIRLECRPAPTVKNVLMAVLIHLERTDDNGTVTLVASQRINKLQVADNNRTTADGYLQSDTEDKESFLIAVINSPTLEDEGVYQCRFAYIDVALSVHTLGSKVNVTVSELPPPDYIPTSDCDCNNVWAEIENLKAALAERNDQPVQPLQPHDERCRVSFSARLATRHGYQIRDNQALVFDHIISNKGNAYSDKTGVFSAPCDGQYFVSATIRSQQIMNSGYVEGVITVDNEAQARTSVYTDAPVNNYQSATNGVVLSLKAGQKVSIVIRTTSEGEFVGNDYSIFSGFFLFP